MHVTTVHSADTHAYMHHRSSAEKRKRADDPVVGTTRNIQASLMGHSLRLYPGYKLWALTVIDFADRKGNHDLSTITCRGGETCSTNSRAGPRIPSRFKNSGTYTVLPPIMQSTVARGGLRSAKGYVLQGLHVMATRSWHCRCNADVQGIG